MKILVTGANGYIGQGVVKKLLNDEKNQIIATDINDDKIDKRAKIITGNLFEIQNPFDYFNRPDAILHLAWKNGFVHDALNHLEDIPRHYVFLKTMLESGVRQLTIMGSMHEVGFYEGCIDEKTPTNPLSLYGIGKDALRKSAELLAKENKATLQWLRGYYIVGNSECGSSIFSKITAAEKQGAKEFPFTSGQNQWDFLDYNDFCNQVAAAVQQQEINGIINVCSGYPEKLADRVERFIKDNHYQIKLKYGLFPDRAYDSKAVWGNDRKIKRILGEI